MPNRSDPTKKLKLGDYVEVLVPLGTDEDGNPTYEKGVVSRAGLSDEKWADVKARAEASGRLSTIKDSEKTRGGSSDVEGDVIRFKDKSGGTVVVARGDLDEAAWSKRVAQAADKDSFESATQDGEVVSAGPSRAKKVGTDNLADEGASPTVATRVGGDGTSPSGGTGAGVTLSVDEGAGTETPVQKPMLTNQGQREPVIDEQASGPRKFFGDAIKGALPGPAGMGTPPGPIPPGQGSLLETDQGAVNMGGLPPAQGQEPQQPLDMTGIPAGTGRSPIDLIKSAGNSLLGPSPGAQMADLQSQSAALQPPPAAAAPMPAPAPVPTDTSLKVSGRGGPSSAPGGVPSLAQAEKDFMAGQKGAVDTAQKGADEQLKARAKYEADSAAFEAAQVKAKGRQREEEDRVNNAYLTTLDEMSKKANIDPDHFWSSKSVGQKAFMAIGGFLAGLGGRDPSGRLDQMINQDIAVQRESYKMAQEQGKAKLAGLDTMYGRLRDRGLDDREAAAAARAAMNEGLAQRLEGLAEQMAPGEAQAKAQLAMSQFRMNKVKAQEDLMMGAAQRAHMRRQDDMASFAMEMKQREAEEKAKGDKKGMQATLSKEMQGLVDQRAALLQMKETSSGGFLKRGAIDAASTIPFAKAVPGLKDLAGKQRTYATRRAEFLKAIYGSVTNADYESAQQSFPPKIQASEDPEPYFNEMLQFVDQQIARREAAYGDATPDTRGESAGGQGGAR